MFRTVQPFQLFFGGGAQPDETLDAPEECEPRGEPPDDDRGDADELGYDLLSVTINQAADVLIGAVGEKTKKLLCFW